MVEPSAATASPLNAAAVEAGVVESVFKLTSDDLSKIVDFDRRDAASLLGELNSKYGGIEGMLNLLHVDPLKGLFNPILPNSGSAKSLSRNNSVHHETSLVERRRVYGRNYIEPPAPKTILGLILETIQEDRIVQILLVGSVISLIFGTIENPSQGWIEGLAIFVAVFIVLTVTSGNDYVKDKKFNKILLLSSDKKVKLWRDAKIDQVSSWDIVVGDIVALSPGDEVPADGLFLRACSLQEGPGGLDRLTGRNELEMASTVNFLSIDESPLTGETISVKKSPKKPFLFAGCQVADGSGFMLVTAVGARSSAGRIQELLNSQQKDTTTLQRKLQQLAVQIGTFGFFAGVVTFLGLTIRWAVDVGTSSEPFQASELLQLIQFFVTGVTIIVVAVPEGLPLAVTISLAFSVFKMIKDNCFVRHLNASETMGEADCICTDKTGTLTENRMTVTKALFGPSVAPLEKDRNSYILSMTTSGTFIEGRVVGQEPLAKDTPASVPKGLVQIVGQNVALNSTCFVKYEAPSKLPIFVGSATEGALLVFADRLGVAYDPVRNQSKQVVGGVIAFNSQRKRMSTLYHFQPEKEAVIGQQQSKYRLYSKGASEIMLKLCTKIVCSPEKEPIHDETIFTTRNLEPADREWIAATISEWAGQGLRTLVLAYRDVDVLPKDLMPGNSSVNVSESNAAAVSLADLEKDLTFAMLVGIKDPVRREVPAAVRQCQKAGLFVRMVTGDNILTASYIARECGILQQQGVAMEGPQFRVMTAEEKKKIIPRLQVLARSSPQDKFELVKMLKEMGHVVGVTGDGTNDAPALKEADVGFAMGQSGTQIAMNASDIILLDDNFTSFVRSIAWGRNILDCVRKFLQFQLAVNIAAIVITFYGAVVRDSTILSAVQLLWINLVMDTLGALALASDEPDADILEHAPHLRNGSLITPQMFEYVSFMAVFQITLIILVVEVGPSILGINAAPLNKTAGESEDGKRVYTLAFTTFILLQVLNLITTKQLEHEFNLIKGFFRNHLSVLIVLLISLVQVLVVQFGSDFTNTIPLTAEEWGFCTAAAALQLPALFLFRLLIRMIRAKVPYHVVSEEERIEAAKKAAEQEAQLKSLQESAGGSANGNASVVVVSSGTAGSVPRGSVSVGAGAGVATASSRRGSVLAELVRHPSYLVAEGVNGVKNISAVGATGVGEAISMAPLNLNLPGTCQPVTDVLNSSLAYDSSHQYLTMQGQDSNTAVDNTATAAATSLPRTSSQRWTAIRSATFMISQFRGVTSDNYVPGRGPDAAFIATVRRFRK